MRFEVQHRFGGSPPEVVAVLADPAFYLELELPDLSLPELLEFRTTGDRSVVRLRYEFEGSLDPFARRLLGRHRLAWIQQVDIDRVAHTGELTFKSEADPRRLHGSARFTVVASGEGSMRTLGGELVVAVPLVGSRAEGHILPGLIRRLDMEAQALDDRLRS